MEEYRAAALNLKATFRNERGLFRLVVRGKGRQAGISRDNNDLHLLGGITASSFEVVQMPTMITSANVPAGTAPPITSFGALPATVTAGAAVTLAWQASGASYYLVTPQIGPARGNSVVVNPTTTATYTLTATNAFGRTQATVTVTVQ